MKGYGFLSFTKNIGKNLGNKYGPKLIDTAKKSTTNAIKTASKRAIQKTSEATGDLSGNKIADKITSISKNLFNKYIIMMKQKKIQKELLIKKVTYHKKKDNRLLMN